MGDSLLRLAILTAVSYCLLIIPGLLLQAGFSNNYARNVAFSPHLSIAVFCGLAIVLSLVGIPTNAAVLVVLSAILCLSVFIISTFLRRRRAPEKLSPLTRPSSREVLICGLFILTGIIASGIIYYMSIYNIDAPVQSYDNLYHYNVVKGLTTSTDWSTLHVTVYSSGISPTSSGATFYPIGWHTIAAILSSIFDISPTVSAHVVNFSFMSIVFSSGSYYFLKAVFDNKVNILYVSALTFCFNAAFPWLLYCVWPLFPNASSLCLVPAVLGGFVTCMKMLVHARKAEKSSLTDWALVILGAVALAFTQPNAVFSCAAILAPYCVYSSYLLASGAQGKHRAQNCHPILISVACAAGIAAIWIVLVFSPPLRGVVDYYWPPITSIWQACVDFALAAYPIQAVQLVPAALVLIGLFYSLLHPKFAWLSASVFFNGLIYVVSASFGDNLVKHILSGFWYTDPYRTAGNLAIISMPLMCLGAACTIKAIYSRAKSVSGKGSALACSTLFLIIIGVLNYTSFFEVRGVFAVHTPYEGITASCNSLTDLSSEDNVVLTQDKVDFLDKVSASVDDSALIANCPFDGSAFSFALDGLNVYSRRYEGFESNSETNLSAEIRGSLDLLECSPDFSAAMREAGFKYVLILDRDFERMKLFNELFHEEDWEGFYSVNDSTLGFEVVLSEGDMRLYEIVYPE